jgi:ElaB/YqjD/DUF883 family membrane-anchored ribosome-binding protein
MDQGRGDLAENVSEILRTRTAIGEKLELLERRVEETVEGAKSAAEDFVDRVRDTADEFLDRTKETFDPTHQVARHPWLMVGGAVLAGYVLGLLETRARTSSHEGSGVYPYYPPDTEEAGAPVMPSRSRTSPREGSGVYPYYPPDAEEPGASVMPSRAHANLWEEIGREVSQEIEHAKEAAIEVGRTFVRDFFEHVIPAVADSLLRRPRQQRFEFSSEGRRGNGSETRQRV